MDKRNEKLTHNLIYNSISLNENENTLRYAEHFNIPIVNIDR